MLWWPLLLGSLLMDDGSPSNTASTRQPVSGAKASPTSNPAATQSPPVPSETAPSQPARSKPAPSKLAEPTPGSPDRKSPTAGTGSALPARSVPNENSIAGPAAPAGETRHAVLMLNEGPVHLRMRVLQAGKSLADARQELARRLLQSLDTNRDGKLSREEAGRSPLLRIKQRESAREFLQSIGANERPLDVRDIEKTIERFGGEMVVYRQDNTAAEPDQRVFDFLDLNSNGVIDPDEIKLAPDRLMEKDLDQDLCLTFDEFAPPQTEPVDIVARMNQQPRAPSVQAELLRDLANPSLSRTLIELYDRDRNRELSAKEIGWSESRLMILDRNANRRLDATELSRMIDLDPELDLDLEVDLNPDGRTARGIIIRTNGVERLDNNDRPDFAKLKIRGVVLSITQRTIDPVARSLEIAMRVFNRLDADANGYLDASEVKDSIRFERGLFELMDADNDGKVFNDEMKQYVAQRGEPAASTCRVNMYDTGFGFFSTLDQNADGRISERERRDLVQSLQSLDRDQTPGISAKEPVRNYQLEFVQGTYSLFGASDQLSSQLPQFQRRATVGPIWFQAMDRNNDGDLSWDEFQASRQDFEQIDADGDELIDPREAFQADAEYERRKQAAPDARVGARGASREK